MSAVEQKVAAIYMAKDAVGPLGTPLMLEEVMFCPVLEWLGDVLSASGVERFFVACEPEWREQAAACMDGLSATVVTEEPLAAFEAFVAETEKTEKVLRIDMPTLPFQGGLGQFSTFKELMDASLYCRDDIMKTFVTSGVKVIDPQNTYIDPRASVAPGACILPGTIIRGRSFIETRAEIGPNSVVNNCTVGEGTKINQSQVNDSVFGKNVRVGPFAYVRPGCRVADNAKVGDFVELKNSSLGEKTSLAHLTYIGDSDVGAGVNFGCGCVTVNYDGDKKYRCTVGDRSFIGCNTNLIAPVSVGEGAYIAAGATITKDVPADALAVARARQENKEGWAKRRRDAKQSKY